MKTEIVAGKRVWTEEALDALDENLKRTDGRSFIYYGLQDTGLSPKRIPGDSVRATSPCGLLKITLYPDNFEIDIEGVSKVSMEYSKYSILNFWDTIRDHWQLR